MLNNGFPMDEWLKRSPRNLAGRRGGGPWEVWTLGDPGTWGLLAAWWDSVGQM